MSQQPPTTDSHEAPVAASAREKRALERGTFREYLGIEKFATKETVGGAALVLAAALALICANSPLADWYMNLRDTKVGFSLGSIDLNLTIGHWAADALLAMFFFLVGLELKRDFIVGELRKLSFAIIPMLAAVGGVVIPALIYTLINLNGEAGALDGWAIPAATDIAFAVSVLALIGSHLPGEVRTFLLTLAVVDDLIAIMIIAIFYTDNLQLIYLGVAIIPIALFWLLTNKAEPLFKKYYLSAWVLLFPLALITWVLFFAAGIHATIAGVALAFMVPVVDKSKYGRGYPLAQTLEHRLRPLTNGVVVPIFAFFSAGVTVGGLTGLVDSWITTPALGVIVGLVLGKILGIVGTTFLVTRFPFAELDKDLRWIDLIGASALAGIGFTVSLLITELSFPIEAPMHDQAKIGVLTASVIASIVGAAILLPRDRKYAREGAASGADMGGTSEKESGHDGSHRYIPDEKTQD